MQLLYIRFADEPDSFSNDTRFYKMTSYLITDVTVFTGDEILGPASVLVEDGRITYVGKERPTGINHKTISKPGHTLLPGLIDAHVHAVGGDLATLSQSLQFGVTTVLEMGNSYKFIEGLREAAKDPNMADYRTATVPATVPGGYPEPMLRVGIISPACCFEC